MNREFFAVLKRALKSQRMTYADLASKLHVSEPTVKRLFVECDCKFSRMIEICNVLDLEISDVFDVVDRANAEVICLSPSVEATLAKSPSLFWFYILLRDDMSCEQIEQLYTLSSADIYLYGRDLERLGLATLGANDRVRILTTRPVQFAADGPLEKLYKEVNMKFVSRTIDESVNGTGNFRSVSRRMTQDSVRIITDNIQALFEKIAVLSRQDKLTSAEKDLSAFKWTIAADAASFSTLMTIGPHPQNKHHAN